MLDNNHTSFFPPQSNCTLWRYMDLTKLLSLLETSKLFFPRSDKFDDPYEGAWSKAGIKLLRDPATNGGLPPEAVDQFIAGTQRQRQEMFISCWFVSDHESAAMWQLYLQSPEGIAIKTDHDSLTKAIDAAPFMGRTTMVRYIDYETTPIPFGNGFFPFIHKRLSFAHENELRAIVWSRENVNKPQIPAGSTSLTIDIEPAELIKAIHVSPKAPTWFGQLVEQLIARYSLTIPVIRSGLYNRPTY
ncbi:hypothetical protein QGP82_05210 [Leptothoe sp. LEGE 181152]|nr:hypothetical protein [Leptothoe sp. LEGE 181152]